MRTIWITGASSGIGKALSKVYDQENHQLVLSSRNERSLQNLAEEIQCKTLILPLDVSSDVAISAAVEQVIQNFGTIDVLINSAGVSQRSLFEETDIATGRKIMDVNFFGTVQMVKAVLPFMRSQGSGEIVVISSAAGKFGFPRRSYYSASKHALHGFADSLTVELKDTAIHLLLVCPGSINTDMPFNALIGDGSTFGKEDKRLAKGISAEQCATSIHKALKRKKHEIYIGRREVLMIYIKRFFPGLYRRIAGKVNAH